MAIPIIDDRIRYVGVSALRGLNAKTLRELKEVLVLQMDEEPLAVLIPWDIYMEIQRALWPSSLLPSLEDVFGPAALAQEEDERAVDLTDPSRERDAVDEMHETPSPFLERVARPSDSTPLREDSLIEKIKQEDFGRDIELTAMGTDMSPRGGKFARVDDSQPPVFDDVDNAPVCNHCGTPSDTSPCANCFTSGHRNGRCLVCTEKADE